MRGYIYVLVSSERPSIVKIGRTEKSPAIRCKEHNIDCYLSINTWEVKDWRWVENCRLAESKIHKLLEKYRLEVKLHREAFRVSVPVAMDVVIRVCDLYPPKSNTPINPIIKKKNKLDKMAYKHIKNNGPLSSYLLKNKEIMTDNDFYSWLDVIKLNL